MCSDTHFICQNEWRGLGHRNYSRIFPGPVPSPPVWRLSQAASDGFVCHPSRMVSLLLDRFHLASGCQYGELTHSIFGHKTNCWLTTFPHLCCLLTPPLCFWLQSIYNQCKINSNKEKAAVPPTEYSNQSSNSSISPTRRSLWSSHIQLRPVSLF